MSERERMRERERKQIGESHRHVGRPRYHYIMNSSEKQEVAHFVSIFTLTVLKSMHFGVPTSPHKMHHFGTMDSRIGTKSFPMWGIVIALICIPLDINPSIIKRDGRFRRWSDIYAGTYCTLTCVLYCGFTTVLLQIWPFSFRAMTCRIRTKLFSRVSESRH